MIRAACFVTALAVLATSACQEPASAQSQAALPAPAASAERRLPLNDGEAKLSLAPVVSRASPAVVNVYAQRTERNPMLDDPFFRRFGGSLGIPQERVQQSLGSGVLVRADGVVVTNNHVISGADKLKVVLADRREFDAKLILSDPQTDLAVLRLEGLEGERLPILPFAETRSTQVGDLVIAIGNPFGLNQTVTSGIVSALARTGVSLNDFSFFVQTDAAINRGNSGGALVDLDGNLVGVNSAILSEGGGSNGIGFAIPSALVRRVVESALSDGRVVRPWLGARGQTVTAELARSMGLDRPQGVILADLYPNGPLERAALRKGDVVLAINGEEIFDEQGLRFQAATLRPGAQVRIDYLRGGTRQSVNAKVEAPPERPAADPRTIGGRNPLTGAEIVTLSPAVAEALGIDPLLEGAAIRAVDGRGPAARLGLQAGDIIRAINGQEIQTSAELERLLTTPARGWAVTVERDGVRQTLTVRA